MVIGSFYSTIITLVHVELLILQACGVEKTPEEILKQFPSGFFIFNEISKAATAC
jgi:hypothetical protein